ncbi:MAG TPA: rhomboid family intramembrane serine protease [Acetobacteraceae bacterium]|nr:rhomboid family intramembrane serine protease [Acetobacteraceae bacterium]
MTDTSQPDSPEITFRHPSLLPLRIVFRLLWLLVVVVVGVISVRSGSAAYMASIALAVEVTLLTAILVGRQVWLRHKGGMPPVRVGPEVITLPAGPDSRRTVMIAYKDVRSAAVLGTGWRARWILDTARGAYVFPLRYFEQSDAPDRLRAAIAERVGGLADGAALLASMRARDALAAELRTDWPWATTGAIVTLVACFCVQYVALKGAGDFGMIDAGANASFLVRDGEWFRVFTASLLHLNLRHLAGNMLMLAVLGTMLERLVGPLQLLIILLATAVASQAASAAAGLQFGAHLYAIGASGGLFGILGALVVVTWRFRTDLPAGFRLSRRVWIVLVGLNMVLLPSLQPQVDKAAHLGGFLAGLLAGVILVTHKAELREVAGPRRNARLALAAVAFLWVAGLAAAGLHAASAAARAGDRYAMVRDVLGSDRFSAAIDNMIAWSVALDHGAPTAVLQQARLLAHRGVDQATQDAAAATGRTARTRQWTLAAVTDTEAFLDYRLGYSGPAADLEAGIALRSADIGSHLALFLQRSFQRDGVRMVGDASPLPTVALDHGVVRLSMPATVPLGGELFALLHRDNALIGVMVLGLPSGFKGEQVLPLPTRRAAPTVEPPPALWTDGRTSVQVVRYDRTGCHCDYPSMGPLYYAYDKASGS